MIKQLFLMYERTDRCFCYKFTVGQKLCAIWNRIRRIEDMHCWYLGIDKIIVHPEFSQQGDTFIYLTNVDV